MKHIVCHFRAVNSRHGAFVALVVLGVVVSAPEIRASRRPAYGGTLRVQISERVDAIDPRLWPSGPAQAAAEERVDSLVFDRLVRLDERGALQPALAISWLHDAQLKRWEFRVRQGVKFSDGSLLAPAVAAMAIQQLLGVSFDVSASSDSVIVQSDRPMPGLAAELATGRYFVFRVAEDNSITGTGSFRVAAWPTTGGVARVEFVANETCWAGRPFVDKIELTMGANPQQLTNGISFDQADVVELPASEVRRAAQRGIRTVSSDPVELFALALDATRPSLQDPRTRQAVSLAIDRTSIADVILQKQGVPAGGPLPNWISGYAHLFPPTFDLPHAKDLLAANAREHSHPALLSMVYDATDVEARAVADRVAVNLREARITVQVTGQTSDAKSKPGAAPADMRLVRRQIVSPDPSVALADLLHVVGGTISGPTDSLEDVYNAERAAVDSFRVIPLVHISESYGLSPQVRDWMAPRWGGWKLEDVWLGPPPVAGGNSQ